jgi:hypothetical protein
MWLVAGVVAVLVPGAFALVRGRDPGPPPPPAPPARPVQPVTFLDWTAHEDRRQAERYEGRFQGWTLKPRQEVDQPVTRNRLQRFLDNLGTALQTLIN